MVRIGRNIRERKKAIQTHLKEREKGVYSIELEISSLIRLYQKHPRNRKNKTENIFVIYESGVHAWK